EHAPEMAWLKPHVRGRSRWTVALSIAASASPATTSSAEPPTRLRLHSNLEGTRLALPEPLDKPAPAALPTTVETTLPLGAGDIDVAFGQRMALRARSAGDRTGVRVVLGSDRVAEPPPASGLAASGRTPTLDAIEWMGLATGGSGEGLPLRSIDVVADRLLLLGGSFPDARLRAQPSRAGTDVRVDSPRLAGSLSIPSAGRAPVTGSFARVFWNAPPKKAGVDAAAPERDAHAGDDGVDPASVP